MTAGRVTGDVAAAARPVRVGRGRGRLPAEHITPTEDIAMTTRGEFLERSLAGTGRGHQVAAMTRLELQA
jgi:hypothetical protein